MKIKTRILAGYGLILVALVGLAIYQIVIVSTMQATIEDFEEPNYQNAANSLQIFREYDLIAEYAEKYFTVAPDDYKSQLEKSIERFDNYLKQLLDGTRSDEERKAVKQMNQFWNRFTDDMEKFLEELPKEKLGEMPPSIDTDLYLLQMRVDTVYEASKLSMSTKKEQSGQTSQYARFVLVSITVVVLFFAIIVSLLIVRSIAKPLAHLTEGTRAITEGKYDYRLDTSRNDEFAQLARDFNSMTHRLSELDEMKKDFVSHVSHELKSPLASMHETVKLLIDQIPGPLNDKQKRLLELNLQSGARLTAMIRNLLDLSKIEAGTMEYELRRQDLVPLVQTAIGVFEVQAGERQIRIETSLPAGPLLVKCDSDRIVQVLVNLVGNAVKFSPNGASVHIRLEPVPEIPETMPKGWALGVTAPRPPECFGLLSIADSGPGIPDSDKFRVFEKFHQVQKGKRVAGQGVGLGLAICHTIVQTHHGAVWVEDNPGGGCCFFLLLSPGDEEEAVERASQPI